MMRFFDDVAGALGPSELTVFHPDVFRAVNGPGTTCIKSDWYDMLHPLVAINSIRSKVGYAPRRANWDHALKATCEALDSPKQRSLGLTCDPSIKKG